MPKARKSFYVPIDQAAACSVAFILLLLYLSMARPKSAEPIEINMPATTGATCNIDGFGEALVLVGQDKVFLQISDTLRKQTLLHIGEEKNIRFSPADLERFKKTAFIGMPVLAYKQEINADNQPGLSLNKNNNELATWIDAAHTVNQSIHENGFRVSIKADKDASYILIKNIISTLQDQNINRFSFITATKMLKEE
jgi:biopolymer transport protein ExbD